MNPSPSGPPDSPPAPKRTLAIALSSVLIAASALVLYLTLVPRPSLGDLGPHRVLGETLAREAIVARENVGRVFVIVRELETFRVPAAEAQLNAFRAALKKAGVPIARTQLVKSDPLRVAAVPPGDFFDLLRNAAQNDVIVSFHGPPVLDAGQLAKLGDKRARVFAVCSGAMPAQVDVRKIFAQGLLRAAVISRPAPAAESGGGGAQGEFDRMFQMITSDNLADLPSSPAARL